MEEYMESELSGIFRVKLVTKNIERWSPGTQFMHMRVKSLKSRRIFFAAVIALLGMRKYSKYHGYYITRPGMLH